MCGLRPCRRREERAADGASGEAVEELLRDVGPRNVTLARELAQRDAFRADDDLRRDDETVGADGEEDEEEERGGVLPPGARDEGSDDEEQAEGIERVDPSRTEA